MARTARTAMWRPPVPLFLALPQHFAGGGIHEMSPIADQAGHRFIAVLVIRGLLSNVALNAEASIGTAINEGRCHAASMASVTVASFGIDQ